MSAKLWPPAGAGAAVAVVLWLSDLLRLSGYAFAGVTDSEAADRVLAVTEAALFSLEARLFVLHLFAGALLGALSALAWRSSAPKRAALLASLFTFAVFATALLAMVARYPQMFSDRWWLSGGILAFLQRTVTHGIGARLLDGLLFLLLSAAAVPIAFSTARRLSSFGRTAKLGKPVTVAAVLLAIAGLLRAGGPARATPATLEGSATNLLILASDSLRSDRIENEEVMPFTASRLERGSLYRYALTPIARTYPAWVSTLTGSEPRAHGVRHMFPTAESRSDVGPTLFTELRDRGYFTFAVSDFAGDVFPGFEGGFESLDTPHLNVDTLAQSTALAGHTWSLAFLRFRFVRGLLPFWRNVPSLADPEWVVDGAIRQLERAGSRPFAGLVFFSTAHFPYVAPYPDYRRGAGDYRGRYLYHVPPVQPDEAPDGDDVVQIRARYDAALGSIDRAMARLVRSLDERGRGASSVLVITGDHGEELYEEEGIAGHGDTLRYLRSQAVPIFLEGPGVPAGLRSSRQVRHYDLAATALALLDPEWAGRDFGHGSSLLDENRERPICVETGIWFWPGRPLGLAGERLDYPGISELLELEPSRRELVLRDDVERLVESAKERGIVLGDRLYREQLTPRGLEKETLRLSGIEASGEGVDLETLFQERCVEGDEDLRRFHGAVVFDRGAKGGR